MEKDHQILFSCHCQPSLATHTDAYCHGWLSLLCWCEPSKAQGQQKRLDLGLGTVCCGYLQPFQLCVSTCTSETQVNENRPTRKPPAAKPKEGGGGKTLFGLQCGQAQKSCVNNTDWLCEATVKQSGVGELKVIQF